MYMQLLLMYYQHKIKLTLTVYLTLITKVSLKSTIGAIVFRNYVTMYSVYNFYQFYPLIAK